MKFKREDLQDLIWGDSDSLILIENKIVDQSRWSVHYDIVFQDKETKKFYSSFYSKGATEYQDESPYEHELELVECEEVFPCEVTTIVYKARP